MKRLARLLAIGAVCFALAACSTSQAKIVISSPTALPSPTATMTPYPTPKIWQRYTASTLFAIDYPFGWIQSPLVENTVNFGPNYSGDGSPDTATISVSISASLASKDIVSWCPAHPTTTIAGLPAAQKADYFDGNPYYEWDAANSAIGLQFIVMVGLQPPTYTLNDLLNFQGVYTHMLQSLTIPAAYAHAAPCLKA